MTAITNTGCFPMRWLIGVGYMTAGLLAGTALWLVSVFVLWPLAMWAVVYGSLLAMAIWLVGAAIYVLRTHRKARAPRQSLFVASAGIVPVFYGVIMLTAVASA